jgi:hypothetical protein
MMRFCFVLFLAFATSGHAQVTYATPIDTFGNQSRVEIVQSATRCEADFIRVEDFMTPEGQERKRPYRVVSLGTGAVLSDRLLADLKALLFQEWQIRKGPFRCLPEPVIRFKLISQKGTVTVLVCNQCGMFFVDEAGKEVGWGIFDKPIAKELWWSHVLEELGVSPKDKSKVP